MRFQFNLNHTTRFLSSGTGFKPSASNVAIALTAMIVSDPRASLGERGGPGSRPKIILYHDACASNNESVVTYAAINAVTSALVAATCFHRILPATADARSQLLSETAAGIKSRYAYTVKLNVILRIRIRAPFTAPGRSSPPTKPRDWSYECGL
ncbi:hypothetical protein EVAR_47043_1 [Eumeta japonica]|uniref:Uncharacterized protein n=1 Tax=Eumeta variegata TaxID=151549 RepID=A0A4C1XFG1_EUMVA|nr:hypothetical protein EVAR_47043_1 [Eumeta japonica]